MNLNDIQLKTTSLDELAECITYKANTDLQLKVIGYEYYNLFISLDDSQRKDMILSSLKQMPEDIIEDIIK